MEIIAIKPKANKNFFYLVAIFHLLAILAVLITGLPPEVKIILLATVGLCYWHLRKNLHSWYKQSIEIAYHEDIGSQRKMFIAKKGWLLKAKDSPKSSWQEAKLESHSILLDFYILLTFTTSGRRQKIHLPILKGDINQDDFRKLKVLLRFGTDT